MARRGMIIGLLILGFIASHQVSNLNLTKIRKNRMFLNGDFQKVTSTDPEQLKVKVYYETLCPDSMLFIRGPLNNAMLRNKWLTYTDLEFVPYGKVSVCNFQSFWIAFGFQVVYESFSALD